MLDPFAISKLDHDIENEDATIKKVQEEDDYDTIIQNLSQKLDKYKIDGARIVSNVPLRLSKSALVDHFNIRFQKNEIIWLKRINKLDL